MALSPFILPIILAPSLYRPGAYFSIVSADSFSVALLIIPAFSLLSSFIGSTFTRTGLNASPAFKNNLDNGLGQSARIMCSLLDEKNEPHVIRDFFVPPGGSRTNDMYDSRLTTQLPYDVNIIHVNASEFMVAYLSLGSIFLKCISNKIRWCPHFIDKLKCRKTSSCF